MKLVVADTQIPTAELLRLDEPAECCAILPRAQGGPASDGARCLGLG